VLLHRKRMLLRNAILWHRLRALFSLCFHRFSHSSPTPSSLQIQLHSFLLFIFSILKKMHPVQLHLKKEKLISIILLLILQERHTCPGLCIFISDYLLL